MMRRFISFVGLGATISSRCLAWTPLKMSAAPTSRRVGIFGGGTVGGGIVEILKKKEESLTALSSGTKMDICKICVRDPNKPRDYDVPPGCEIVTDYDAILQDDSIDTVVEVMGGTTDAKDVVYAALRAGKDVVTANKALIAAHLSEIDAILEEVNSGRDRPVEFRYEAAVCGGIPVIRSLLSDFVGDSVSEISGVINGCTNFMLTCMDREGWSYDDALARAAELGYAEADPTLDVGGFDARSKLRILMRLAFGVDVEEDEISVRGITDLTKIDFEYAAMLKGTIKIVGVARRLEGGRLTAFVSPTYVSNDDTLANVNYATNAIEVISDNLESSTFTGQGAGRYPTANSCVNDMLALAKGDSTAPHPFGVRDAVANSLKYVNDYESQFYIRLKYRDMLGITRQCGEICENTGVSIHSLLQNPVRNRDDATFVIVTEKVALSAVKKAVAMFETLDWCRGSVFFMPVLRDEAI
uniref:Homoserine dehydrogenase n=1 Tax=Corethron hystrix TaxID=216773 RepID=A0A7S1BM92_9STRA|mmetsp:Transcript_33831/g.78120  ORF Transcript_33831/g.78120 Transcript_33831/m.78120 type:complete len:471 (+) Transcript_33831:122-1534(+)|eukprot:CAMPEP_0113309552 /NCGR_PEP_ID=MMETSP0010_2-20120614/7547_1 /TAXON_ID=216773 ORGANISM="Corethron hystrix, Strain 308" /NCGR_SAMPLE_ID=MMETSP0010_2 /ASSEMBLY_ACC=CAM_ASM_000155 /LENGTH=470 /DNA_ID=CAMNT_0000164821 /DNA_START=111 /DNA_END=1523 /DNA_ORIENTATION=+ /assembly_acc=CAM_ASM_000155